MKIDVKIPEVGESVQEALLAQWYAKDGDMVRKGEILFVIETDKVTLEVSAEADGILKIVIPEGETVAVGTVVAIIDTAGESDAKVDKPPAEREKRPSEGLEGADRPSARAELPPEAADKLAVSPAARPRPLMSPSVKSLVEERGIDVSGIVPTGPGGRLTKGDALLSLEASGDSARRPSGPPAGRPSRPKERIDEGERTVRKPMSRIRRRIAERMLEARRNTAMLTTFNEIDMSRLQAVRGRFRKLFEQKHSVSLGIMSFFIKASITALKEIPEVNASIEGNDIVYHNYYDIGVAIGAERGLVVPVIRDADRLSFAEIERAIVDYVGKIKENRLEISDIEGGTFTISNGGVYGSLLSTPILNPPQSGILGMHRIEDRPVVVDGQIVIRPMMYVALSYDHRIVDGREAVTFLKRIKECVENPERMTLEV